MKYPSKLEARSPALIVDDYYVLRTPRLSIDFFMQEARGLTPDNLSTFVRTACSEVDLDEAAYLASPELHQQYKRWVEGTLEKSQVDKLLITLYKYLVRMSSRPTPFGLFAGCATGNWDVFTQVIVDTRKNCRRHSRLDMNYVAELAAGIAAIPVIRDQLRFYPNNSLYQVYDRYRYVGYKLRNKARSYNVISVDNTPYLSSILQKASKGALLSELAAVLKDGQTDESEVNEFLTEVVASQLLVSELEPTVTGQEFFYKLKHIVAGFNHTEALSQQMERIAFLLAEEERSTDRFEQIFEIIKALGIDTTSKDLIQTDLFFCHPVNRLSRSVADEISRDIEDLYRITPFVPVHDLEDFKAEFYARYEEREVPLSLALDVEIGVGYGRYKGNGEADNVPLIEGVRWKDNSGEASVSLSKLSMLRVKKYCEALKDGLSEIVITEEDIQYLDYSNYRDYLPASLFVIGDLLGRSAEGVDNGEFEFVLKGVSGPSSGNLTARFCHGDDVLRQRVQASLEKEKAHYKDRIIAEIVHLPSARMGNILMRPIFRDYEIPYLCGSALPDDFVLPLEDLLVSVKSNRVILRSKRLKKEILPRLTTAHSYSHTNLMVYKFLCDLQFQDNAYAVFWSWGFFESQAFLPRVKLGKTIISKAIWNLNSDDQKALVKGGTGYKELVALMRLRFKLPECFMLVEGENEFFIDTTSEVSVRVMFDEWRKKGVIRLTEFMAAPENCFIKDDRQLRYVNELVLPVSSLPINSVPPASGYHQKGLRPRTFAPGSDWLYVKLYSGTNTCDRILTGHLLPVISDLLAEGVIEKWFFIRYADPKPHIRVRFYNSSSSGFWKMALERLHQELDVLVSHHVISAFQVDTYQREIERYGEDNLEDSETFFFYDSMAVANCLQLLDGEDSEHYRWQIAAKSVDCLLIDFKYDLQQKMDFVKGMRDQFFNEFKGDVTMNQELNDKYRSCSNALKEILESTPAPEDDPGFAQIRSLFSERSAGWADVIAQIRAKGEKVTKALLPSYVHMSLNRIFISNHRKHELVIYHFLHKFYNSQMARIKYKSGY
ncbi:MAG: lantibiotic dehydratase [Bacteroidetes bacterium]|nr:lantibiotic dehydratase [Bacteroidota bacterium]